MAAEKGRKLASTTQDFLKLIKSNAVEVSWNDGKADVLNRENIAKFVRGEITWAQAQGLTMEQAYGLAEIGYHLLVQGKYKDAQTVFEGLVVLNPYDGYFHSVLGSIFARTGNVDKAIREYSIAANLEPADPQVFVNRAELLLKKGQFEEALNDLREAVASDPDGHNPAVARARSLAAATVSLIEEILKTKQHEPKQPAGTAKPAAPTKPKK